jgi:hypothetical protein
MYTLTKVHVLAFLPDRRSVNCFFLFDRKHLASLSFPLMFTRITNPQHEIPFSGIIWLFPLLPDLGVPVALKAGVWCVVCLA